MRIWPFSSIASRLVNWLMKEHPPVENAVCDFDRICYELEPCDVLLVDGRSRVSEVIRVTTRSNWSHCAIFIGRFSDIKDDKLLAIVKKHYKGHPREPLLVEVILGKGVMVSPVSDYKYDHLRLCRPCGISKEDADRVIAYCIKELGSPYNIRRIMDLMRFMFPVTFMPRYLFSSLANPSKARHEHTDICSSLLAKAFASVKYPILPRVIHDKDGKRQLIPRNSALFTPRDFDYSPYFQIIKYPLFGFSKKAAYQNFPWTEEGLESNDADGIYDPKEHTDDIEKAKREEQEKDSTQEKDNNNPQQKDDKTQHSDDRKQDDDASK